MRLFLGIFLFLLLLLAVTPTVLSSKLGKKLLDPIQVQSLSLNWLSPQVLQRVYYKDDGVDLTIDKIVLEKSLFSLLFSPMDWGTLQVVAPRLKTTVQGEEEIRETERKDLSFFPPVSRIIDEKGEIEVDGVALHNLSLDISRENGLEKLPFQLTATSSTELGRGKIEATGVLKGPDDHFLPESFDLQVERFPLATLDALLEEPFLVRAFGPLLSLHGQLEHGAYTLQVDGEKIQGGGTNSLNFNWSPDPTLLFGAGPIQITFDQQNLVLEVDAMLNGELGFLGPKLSFHGSPEVFTMTAEHLKLSPVKLKWGKTISLLEPLKGELTRLPSPYKITSPLLFELNQASIKKNSSSLAFEGRMQGGVEKPLVSIPHFALKFSKEKGSPVYLDGDSTLSSTDESLGAMLGGQGHLVFSAQGLPIQDEKWVFDPVSFQFKAPLLQADGYLVIDSDGKIEGGEPFTVHYTLTPQALQRLQPNLPPLQEPAQITVEVSLNSSLVLDQLKTWNFQTTLTTPTLKFEKFSFNQLIGSVDVFGERSELLATLEAKSKGKSFFGGSLSADLHVKDFISGDDIAFENSNYSLSANLHDFPTFFLKQAEELFGQTVSLQVDSKGTVDKAQGTATVDSERMQGNVAWQWDEQVLALSSPRFDAIIPASYFGPLLEPVPVSFEIDNLTIPRDSYFEGSGKGTLHTDPTTVFAKESGKRIPIPAFNGEWFLDKSGLHYSLKSENEGLSMSGVVRSRLPLPEEFSLQDVNFSLLLKGIDLPSSLISLAPSLYRLEPVLEPTFTLELDVKLDQGNGPVAASLISPNGTLSLDGRLEDGWFYLNRQLDLSIQMTPKVAKGLLGEIVPFVSSGVRGRSPIRVAIAPKDFYVPINPFDIRGLEIGQAVVELDQLEVNPTEDLGDLLSLLKVETTPGKPEMLWFTPLYVSYHKGIATLRRVDILIANKYPVALWGKVDLEKDRVNLELGLGAKTLSQAFGMKKLPKDYILPISLRGTLSSTKIDKPKATAKIGALLAQIEGSPQGLLLSGVLDLMSGGLMSEAVPPPTTSPFPWATDEELEEAPHPNTPMKKILKGVEQGAKSLLKKIF